MKVVILAGGKGTRFWPRSVERKPKQFLALTSRETMLQTTYRRFASWLPANRIYVITTRAYRPLVEEQLPDLASDRIIEEPAQRDTGPCMALTAYRFLSEGDDEVIVTAPSDQYIPDERALQAALEKAEQGARHPLAIVTLGIRPSRPETGYGYIETAADQELPADDRRNREILPSDGLLPVKRFIEKPSLPVAEQLISQPNIYWNSGIFVWRPSTIAHYMKIYHRSLWDQIAKPGPMTEQQYLQLPKLSVDYAILEKAETIWTVPVDFEWDDVGLWTSLERIQKSDEEGNLLQGDVYTHHSERNIVYTDNKPAIVIGAQDLIIVSTDDGLLVCRKTEEQEIKTVLQQWEQRERRENE
ncbi:mannose-1-phosphate guanylyltransferase [Paenibacillus senegalensis]|uniref:mannose-1-phosphate guanylyltransferase n=1 Tax=Paenibacillus senegalensis TaxID=1465766 RepID=UPI000289BB23|nr:sugar phosphate nucleotidyltransferase [Paenibacillus senegalensis]